MATMSKHIKMGDKVAVPWGLDEIVGEVLEVYGPRHDGTPWRESRFTVPPARPSKRKTSLFPRTRCGPSPPGSSI